MGFTMEPERAAALIAKDPRNNGQDVNSDPYCAASRWVINFHDWPLDRAEQYPELIRRVRELLKPDRDKVRREQRRKYWWRYAERSCGLYNAIATLRRVIVLAQVSRTAMPALVSASQVFSHKIIIFASDDSSFLSLLSSTGHYVWAIKNSATMKADLSYSPSDVLLTFPLPELTAAMGELDNRLDIYRGNVMLSRQVGLTKTFNLVHDPACTDSDITELRAIHRGIDEATVRAYGWDDLLDELDHGFPPAGGGTRFTMGQSAQREILDRVLELNYKRYAEEVTQGLHDKRKGIDAVPPNRMVCSNRERRDT